MYLKQMKFGQKLLPKQALAVIVMMVILGLTACQPVRLLPETKAVSAASSATRIEEANKAVIQRLYEEIINQKDLSVADEIFDAHVLAHDTGDEGSEAAKAGLAMVLSAFPDLKVTVDFWVLDGELVASQVSFHGTQRGEFIGVAPTSKPVAWSHIDIHRVQNGKIVEIWHNIPVTDIMLQLGYELVPSTK